MTKNIITKILILIFVSFSSPFGQAKVSDISSRPGAFSRLGFGARGIGMGNALASVTHGNIMGYYNPALSAFQDGNYFGAGYSFLSLDRNLNFLNFTRKFEFGKKKSASGKKHSVAGLSIGLINSGVNNIDARDNQGRKTGLLSTSENMVHIALANRFSEKFALGISFKFYYYKLYENITSTGMGMDIGAVYLLNKNINIAFVIRDINSKYRWDTTQLYGQAGNTVEETFPLMKTVALSYFLPEYNLNAAVEWESSNAGTNYLRFGIESYIIDAFALRAGFDKLDLSNSDIPVQPSFGFSYNYKLNNLTAEFIYAFSSEPYSAFDRHIIGLSFIF